MGTQIYARGISFEHCFDELNLSQPDVILDVHRAYVEAGAEIIETNTFGANRFRLIEHELENKLVEIIQSGVRLARKAADESRRKIYVAASIGPLGVRLAPLGRVSAIEAFDAFKEQISALADQAIDALMFETFSDLGEITQAIKAAKEVAPDLPIIAQMTFTEDGCTPLGDAVDLVAQTLIELGANVIGANCSVGPARLLPVIQTLARHAQACSGTRAAGVDSAERRLAAAHGAAPGVSGHARIFRRLCAAFSERGRDAGGRVLRHDTATHPRDAGRVG